MENPFKEPQKGCILCNVQVDYKNIQSLLRFHCVQNGDDVFIVLVFVVSLGAAADGGNRKASR
ncbi:hypothetical protein INR49_010129, partial [Caranx melampygus]